MTVISDAGPLRYLIVIGESELFAKLYTHLIIPVAVLNELSQPNTPPLVSNWMNHRPAWLEVRAAPFSEHSFPSILGEGERQAITLAETTNVDALLIDDGAARREDLRRKLPVQGTLGVLATAAELGLVNLPHAIQRLRHTNFRASERLLQSFLDKTPQDEATAHDAFGLL